MRVVFAGLALAVLAAVSLFTGFADIDPGRLFTDAESFRLMAISRIPRTLAAALAGASMAVAGMIMQMLARNRFVEPTTAGTAECAALGILVASILYPAAPIQAKMLLASIAAVVGTAGFLAMVRRLPVTQPLLVPLVGIVYGGIVASVVTFVAYRFDLLQLIGIWISGEFSGVVQGRYELLWASGLLALAAYTVADRFTIIGLGRDASISLGLNYRRVMVIGLVIVSLITAFNVVTVGMLPFVGLVVPNVVSRLLGDNLRISLPWIAYIGAFSVLACDVLGRLIRYPYEVPAGVLFGVLGTAVFLWLLFARPRHA